MPFAAAEPRAGPPPRRQRRFWIRLAAVLLVVAWAGVAIHHARKSLPPGVRTAAPWTDVAAPDVRFLHDVTIADAYGRAIVEQQIFDQALAIVGHARRFVVLDYFLFNDWRSAASTEAPLRPLAHQLEAALLERKREIPGLEVLFITDPINEVYGGESSPALARLRAAGITVLVTDLDRLPDPNPLYSGLWRLAIRWWAGSAGGRGALPNPLDNGPDGLSFLSWARLLNLKANHRKVLIADDGESGRLIGLVGSANPHDASSAHSNVALEVTGAALAPLLDSELAVARASGWLGVLAPPPPPPSSAAPAAQEFAEGHSVHVRAITEGAIATALLEAIRGSTRGESIDVAMFYLSDRDVIEALTGAAARGVTVRVLLDPNKDAFGHEKSGMPNRQVASELVSASDGAIKVRWYRTHGEQFHTKLCIVRGRDRLWFTLGSANLTRRNLGDYNLEANLAVEAVRSATIADEVTQYFETLWSNRAPSGVEYSAPYDVFADSSQGRYWLYRVIEATGLSTF